MRFLRVICNILLFIFIFLTASVIQITVYDIYAIQSEDVDGIHVISPSTDDVSVLDSVGFWTADIGASFSTEAKYRVRNWADSNWWKSCTGFIDKGIDIFSGVVKPIILPISEVNAVKNYYGLSINDFTKHLAKYNYETDEDLNNALYELYILFDRGYGDDVMTVGENPIEISEYEYTGKYLDSDIEFNEKEYGHWVAENKKLYNHNWKLIKYNNPIYTQYFEKFVDYDEKTGARHIESAAIVLYYQFLVSIVISIIFVIKYPITLLQYNVAGKKKKSKGRRHNLTETSDIDLLDD